MSDDPGFGFDAGPYPHPRVESCHNCNIVFDHGGGRCEAHDTPTAAAPPEQLYCIQDTRSFVGNSVVWWRVGGHGYTPDIDEAWILPEVDARRIEQNRSTDKAIPVEKIEAAITRHVDAQRLR